MEHTVVVIQFNRLGKKYYFDTANIDVKKGDKVVVETARGIELGFVTSDKMVISNEELVSPLKPIVRLATEEDIRNYEAYLDSVQGLVAENRKIVARMQAAYDGQSVDKKKATTGGTPRAPGGQIPGQETADEVAVLDAGRIHAHGPARELLSDESLMRAHGLRVPLSLRLQGT